MTATTATTATGNQNLVKLALNLDALVTGVNGLAYLALAGPLHDLLGLSVGFQRGIGVFLLAYAVVVWAVGRPARVSPAAVGTVIAANLLWAVASVLELELGGIDVNTLGAVWVVLQAVVVAAFAALQYAGLRQAR
ncbi:hypothetical protein [Microbispora sp. NPDC049125]|uniref:hypothetical protein n=1 Tax=Microbispora sp. NPDC049125 TaxID=3154929 RepID=UPI0034668C2F